MVTGATETQRLLKSCQDGYSLNIISKNRNWPISSSTDTTPPMPELEKHETQQDPTTDYTIYL